MQENFVDKTPGRRYSFAHRKLGNGQLWQGYSRDLGERARSRTMSRWTALELSWALRRTAISPGMGLCLRTQFSRVFESGIRNALNHL
jgi:hypothetical protein